MALTYSSTSSSTSCSAAAASLGGAEHDETFIIIHQVYELWFKELVHEFEYLRQLLPRRDAPRALHTPQADSHRPEGGGPQIDVLETMTPLEFLSFRDRLQSGQRISVLPVPGARVRAGREGRPRLDRYPPARRSENAWRRATPSPRSGTRS